MSHLQTQKQCPAESEQMGTRFTKKEKNACDWREKPTTPNLAIDPSCANKTQARPVTHDILGEGWWGGVLGKGPQDYWLHIL